MVGGSGGIEIRFEMGRQGSWPMGSAVRCCCSFSMPWATTLAVRKGAPHGGMANKLSETKQAPLSPQIPALSAERARRPGGSQAEEHSGEEELEAEAPSFVGAA
jgi:hypothetical protein